MNPAKRLKSPWNLSKPQNPALLPALFLLFIAFFNVAYAQLPIQWENNLGGSNWDVANDIEQTTDGGYVVAGESESSDGDVIGNQGEPDFWILK